MEKKIQPRWTSEQPKPTTGNVCALECAFNTNGDEQIIQMLFRRFSKRCDDHVPTEYNERSTQFREAVMEMVKAEQWKLSYDEVARNLVYCIREAWWHLEEMY